MQALPSERGRLLPRLERNGDRKTRSEVFDNLAAISGPMLARYDLATGILGWLEEDGQFRLNTQRGLALDSGLAPACLNRLIKRLGSVGYVKRRIELVTGKENGEQFVRTRVLIQFTDLFWRHMRLSLAHGLARKAARKRRLRLVHQIGERRLKQFTKREQLRKRKETSAERRSPTYAQPSMADLHSRIDLLLELRAANPSLDAAAINALADEILARKR